MKKSSQKKAAKKTTAKKAAKKAASKTAPKKAPAKKAAPKKAAAKKTAPKKAAVKQGAVKKAAAKSTGKESTKKPSAKKAPATSKAQESEMSATAAPIPPTRRASKSRKDTPAVFKIKKTKNTPVVFSLDEVREVLKERKEGGRTLEDLKSEEKPARKVAEQKKVVAADAPVENRSYGAASLADILGYNPDESASPARAAEEAKVPTKFIKYYRALAELRDHVREELTEHTQERLHRSSKEDSGDLSGYGQHQADAGTDAFDRDFALSLVSNEQDALYEIEEAIKRIFDGTYGICEQTGQAIKKDRLMAVPFTRFSVEGQRQFEAGRRKKVERGGVFSDVTEDGPKIEEPEE